MWAALEHMAGLGPHPGKYKGPPHPGVHPDTITETDLQRAREGEMSSKKMKDAMRGGDLGPEQFEQEEVKQAGALQRLAGTAGQQQAAVARAAQVPVNAPPAPSGSAGVTKPFPAQQKSGAVPTTGKTPKPARRSGSGRRHGGHPIIKDYRWR
jgi:hypothetical protein